MTLDNEQTISHEPKKPVRRKGLAVGGIVAIGLLALGVAGGAGAMKMMGPTVEMAPLAPVAITAMPTDSVVTIKGSVAEIFGNKFVLQDESGRMLVETGREGEGGKLVAPGEAVTVQGRFDDGFLKASFIVHPDGKTQAIGPAGGPPKHADGGPHKRKGPDRGPDRGPGEGPGKGPDRGPGAEQGPGAEPGPGAESGPGAAPGEVPVPAPDATPTTPPASL